LTKKQPRSLIDCHAIATALGVKLQPDDPDHLKTIDVTCRVEYCIPYDADDCTSLGKDVERFLLLFYRTQFYHCFVVFF
jgi:hypothetical protein